MAAQGAAQACKKCWPRLCLPHPAPNPRPGVCPRPQLPPGRPLNEAIDYELQDLKKRMGNN